MPGTPIENKMWADIAAMGGPDGVLERVANGESMQKMADEMQISRSFLSWKINAIPGMKDKLIAARRARADKWAEEAMQIADDVAVDPNEINKAKVRIDTRKWLAGIDDPDRYGTKAAQVNVSIGGLHLDALRRVQADLAKPVGPVIEGSVAGEPSE